MRRSGSSRTILLVIWMSTTFSWSCVLNLPDLAKDAAVVPDAIGTHPDTFQGLKPDRLLDAVAEGGVNAGKEVGTACACTPEQVEQGTPAGCTKCGTQTPQRVCLASCQWGDWTPGTCLNQGVCDPGSTKTGSCNNICEITECSESCTWGCVLKPGAQCAYESKKSCKCNGVAGEKVCEPACTWGACYTDAVNYCW